MIKPIVTDTKVVFGPCRLSYTHLFQKYNPNNDADGGKYTTNVLIPKTETETIAAIQQAIEAAKQRAISSKWNGRLPKKLEEALRDGEDKEKDLETYAGHYYLNAKCKTRPGVVDRNSAPITDEDEVYSGMWAYVSVTFFGYSNAGKNGIACGLNNVMKFKDGEPLGGRSSAESDFAGLPQGGFSDDDDM